MLGDGVLNITVFLESPVVSILLSSISAPTLFMIAAMATFLWNNLGLGFTDDTGDGTGEDGDGVESDFILRILFVLSCSEEA